MSTHRSTHRSTGRAERFARSILLLLVAAALPLTRAPVARAAIFVVDATDVDAGDLVPGDGVCAWSTLPPTTCPPGFPTNVLYGVDPMLGPLQDNGGATPTRKPLPGSPALDAASPLAVGTPGGCPATDQRGVARPQPSRPGGVDRCDMGAVEVPEAPVRAASLAAVGALSGLVLARRRSERRAPGR
jgi:hypothetical protein